MFYCDKHKSLAIAQIPKAGLQSMNEWLKWPIVDNDCARQMETRVAFFRYPLERLKAAYSMWFYSGYASFIGGDWHYCVDRVLDEGWTNEHFQPQAQLVEDIPTVYHRFEDLNEIWEQYHRGHLPHMNSWSRVPDIDDYRKTELLAYYADDLVIWEAASAP